MDYTIEEACKANKKKKIYKKNKVNNLRFFPNYRMDVYSYHKQYFIVDHVRNKNIKDF